MTRIFRVALLLSALALTACATKKEPVTAEPATPAVTQESTKAAPPPAPPVAVEVPTPRHVVKKHRKHRKIKVAPPPQPVETVPAEVAAPVSAPAPAPAEQPISAPPAVQATPTPVAEQGFLGKYWIWLIVAIIAIAAIVWATMRKKE